jgi:hypothetical protein
MSAQAQMGENCAVVEAGVDKKANITRMAKAMSRI